MTGYAAAAESHHATIVTSIAAGDYLDGQANGLEGQIAQGLGQGWKTLASGFAEETWLSCLRNGSSESAAIKAYDCARGMGPKECAVLDVLNQSQGWPAGWCSATSFRSLEGALENAWDAGVLPVVVTHNHNNYPSDDACRVYSPADMPKALAVGAVDAVDEAPYEYHAWPYAHYSNRGGGPIKVGVVTFPTSMSHVDLVASGRPGYVTDKDGNYGTVAVDGPHNGGGAFSGTSFAAPQVSAAAILVKHRHLDLGYTWISSPGRLHAAMLTMGDRASTIAGGSTWPGCLVGDRIICGSDRYYGLG